MTRHAITLICGADRGRCRAHIGYVLRDDAGRLFVGRKTDSDFDSMGALPLDENTCDPIPLPGFHCDRHGDVDEVPIDRDHAATASASMLLDAARRELDIKALWLVRTAQRQREADTDRVRRELAAASRRPDFMEWRSDVLRCADLIAEANGMPATFRDTDAQACRAMIEVQRVRTLDPKVLHHMLRQRGVGVIEVAPASTDAPLDEPSYAYEAWHGGRTVAGSERPRGPRSRGDASLQ